MHGFFYKSNTGLDLESIGKIQKEISTLQKENYLIVHFISFVEAANKLRICELVTLISCFILNHSNRQPVNLKLLS